MRTQVQNRDERDEVLSPFQAATKTILEMIAELEPDAGDQLSEACIFMRTAPTNGAKEWRDIVRTAFEVAADRGHWRRSQNHWQVLKRFRQSDVNALMNWRGRWVSHRSNGSHHIG